MSAFQHVVTLLAFVLALGVAHELLSVVAMVRAGSRLKLSGVHAVWMVVVFLEVPAWWFGIWDFRNIKDWPFISVMANFLSVVFVFLAVAFVCPELPETGTVDLWTYHQANKGKYALFVLLANTLATAIALYYGSAYSVSGQTLESIYILIGAAGALAAIVSSSANVQWIAALTTLAGTLLYFVVADPVLRSG
jgi:hypothetical protein